MGNHLSHPIPLDWGPSVPPTPFQTADLQNATGFMTGTHNGCNRTCTVTETRMCHIAKHLSIWNEFLYPLNVRLKNLSESRGQLCLESFDDYVGEASEELLHQAVKVVYLLLSTHRCVSAVDIDVSYFQRQNIAIFDALCLSPFLKSLKVTVEDCSGSSGGKNVWTVISSSRHLEELEVRGNFESSFVYLISPSMSFPTGTYNPGIEAFLTDLKAKGSLKELSVHESAIQSAECGSMFASFLKNTVTLTTLTYTVEKFWYTSLRILHEVLLVNSTVSKLNIFFSPFCKLDTGFPSRSANVLADIVFKNETLRIVSISYKEVWTVIPRYPLLPSEEDWDYWVTAVKENDKLEEVTIPVLLWKKECWGSFFSLLPGKQQLRKVTLHGTHVRTSFLQPVCDALRGSGAEFKVHFAAFGVDDGIDVLKCKAFSKTILPPLISGMALIRTLRQLPQLTHITSVSLLVLPYRMNQELSSAFAQFIRSTTTLNKLVLETALRRECPNGSWTAIFQSLLDNRSIRQLRVALHLDKQDAEHLANVVTFSRSISRAKVRLPSEAEAEVFAESLSTGIAENYVLLSICLQYFPSCTSYKGMQKEWFLVLDTAQRNASFVTQAAQFLTRGRSDRCGAEAVEMVFHHPGLKEGLAEELSLPKNEAEAMVRRGLRSFQILDDFMRLAGVVKERVACNRSDDGRPQLDDLGADCWALVRGYLRLCDILDNTTPPYVM